VSVFDGTLMYGGKRAVYDEVAEMQAVGRANLKATTAVPKQCDLHHRSRQETRHPNPSPPVVRLAARAYLNWTQD
jgi:hypothetical protein